MAGRARLRLPSRIAKRRCQCPAEAERPRCEQHILHRRIMDEPDARVGVSPFDARHDLYGSLVDVRRQTPPRRAASENAPGSFRELAHRPDTAAQPAHPRRVGKRPRRFVCPSGHGSPGTASAEWVPPIGAQFAPWPMTAADRAERTSRDRDSEKLERHGASAASRRCRHAREEHPADLKAGGLR
jgi:hypothetical protein